MWEHGVGEEKNSDFNREIKKKIQINSSKINSLMLVCYLPHC